MDRRYGGVRQAGLMDINELPSISGGTRSGVLASRRSKPVIFTLPCLIFSQAQSATSFPQNCSNCSVRFISIGLARFAWFSLRETWSHLWKGTRPTRRAWSMFCECFRQQCRRSKIGFRPLGSISYMKFKNIRKLVYPPWYVACFSARHDNAAMWSYYAWQSSRLHGEWLGWGELQLIRFPANGHLNRRLAGAKVCQSHRCLFATIRSANA